MRRGYRNTIERAAQNALTKKRWKMLPLSGSKCISVEEEDGTVEVYALRQIVDPGSGHVMDAYVKLGNRPNEIG